MINSSQVQVANDRLNIFVQVSGKAEVAVKGLGNAASGASIGMGSLWGMALKLAGVLGAAGLAMKAFQQAVQFEQLQVGFKSLLGSAEKANAMLDKMSKFAAATPFEFMGLANNAKLMLAMGFEADKLLPTLRAIGDAAAQAGGGEESIMRIIVAFGQMRAAGKVNSQDMMQLTSQNIAAWQMLADASGKSIMKIRKDASKGLLDANVAIDLIVEGMNKKFGGGMDALSKTIGGLMSTLKDEFNLVLREIGLTAIEVLGFKDRIKDLIQLVKLGGAVLVDFIRGLAGADAPKWLSNKSIFEAGQLAAAFFKQVWEDITKGWYHLLEAFQLGWEIFRYGALAAIDSIRAALAPLLDLAAKLADYFDPQSKGVAFLSGVSPMLGSIAGSLTGGGIAGQLRGTAADLRTPLGGEGFGDFMGRMATTREGYAKAREDSAKTGFVQDFRDLMNTITGGYFSRLQDPGALSREMAKSEGSLQIGSLGKADPTKLYAGAGDLGLAALKKMEDQLHKTLDVGLQVVEMARDTGKAFSSSLEDAIFSGKELSEVLRNLLVDLEKIAFRAVVTEPLGQLLGVGLGQLGLGLTGALAGGGGGASANDAAWNKFLGGENPNSIWGKGGDMSPTGTSVWSSASGNVFMGPAVSLVGERQPEVVLPVERGPGGVLGVRSQGGSGGTQNFHFHYHGPDAQGMRKSQRQMAQDARRMFRE